MKTKIIVPEHGFDGLGPLQDYLQREGLNLTPPPEGESNIVCLYPNDHRFVCLWKDGKPIWKPGVLPSGTRIAVAG